MTLEAGSNRIEIVIRSGRYIVAAIGDRVTTPERGAELWRHWEQPDILWVRRGHLGVFAGRTSKAFVRHAPDLSSNGETA
jgi:hypothetical protein